MDTAGKPGPLKSTAGSQHRYLASCLLHSISCLNLGSDPLVYVGQTGRQAREVRAAGRGYRPGSEMPASGVTWSEGAHQLIACCYKQHHLTKGESKHGLNSVHLSHQLCSLVP